MPEVEDFVALLSRTRWYKPGTGRSFLPDEFACAIPEDLEWIFKNLEGGALDGWHYLSAVNSLEFRRNMSNVREIVGIETAASEDVSPEIMPLYWSDFWIPLFCIEHNSICVDFEPTPKGSVGQVIRVSDESDQRVIVSPSVREFCAEALRAYRSGNLRFTDFGAGPELVSVERVALFVWRDQ